MNKRHILAAVLLTVFCLNFFRADTAQKSMVRALLLEPVEGGWTVGLLYQAPESAADSSEAAAEIQFAAARADTLEQALIAAQSSLPQNPNYRLCDHLVLLPGCSWQTLGEVEEMILCRSCGRTAALVSAASFGCEDLSAWSEEQEGGLTQLLEQLKAARQLSPRLYEKNLAEGLLLPMMELGESEPRIAQEGWFVGPDGTALWDARQTALYRMLSGQGEGGRFWLEDGALEIRRCICSVESDGAGGYLLRLDCQTADASRSAPDQGEAAWLEQLCVQSVRQWWAQGLDPLGLGGFSALQYGAGEMLQPAKNACPQLRADVRFMSFF